MLYKAIRTLYLRIWHIFCENWWDEISMSCLWYLPQRETFYWLKTDVVRDAFTRTGEHVDIEKGWGVRSLVTVTEVYCTEGSIDVLKGGIEPAKKWWEQLIHSVNPRFEEGSSLLPRLLWTFSLHTVAFYNQYAAKVGWTT